MKTVTIDGSGKTEEDVIKECVAMRVRASERYVPVVPVNVRIDNSMVNGMFEDDFD
jgi:hypothetical protein